MALLDPLLNPLLKFDSRIIIISVSFLFALVSSLANKYFTNQKLIKSHKAELKKLQKEAKEIAKTNPEKSLALQQRMMELNMVVMKESFKPALITMVPFILIFGWINANISYIPIHEGQVFDVGAEIDGSGLASLEVLPAEGIAFISNNTVDIVDGYATWQLKGLNGTYTLKFIYQDDTANHDLIIGDHYDSPEQKHSGNIEKTFTNQKLKFDILGFNISWFIAYIVSSILFSMLFRKVLKIA